MPIAGSDDSMVKFVFNGTRTSGMSAERMMRFPSPNKGRNQNGIIAPHAEPDILEKYIRPVFSGIYA